MKTLDASPEERAAAEIERLRARVKELEATLGSKTEGDVKLGAILKSIPAVMLQISVDGVIEFVNRVLPEYAGVPLLGRSIYAFAPSDQHDVMREALERTRSTHQISSYESLAEAPDGTRDWYFNTLAPLLDGSSLVGLTMICVNISRMKVEEGALRRSHRRTSMALAAGDVGLWHWDRVRDVLEWDDRLCAMFGLTQEEAPATNPAFLSLVSDDQREAVRQHIEEAVRTGFYQDLELRVDLPSQTKRYLLKGAATRDASGKVDGLLGGMVDVTFRVRLEGHVRETQKLEAVGQLSAGIAHNFNNMLAAVVPALELARNALPGPDNDYLDAAVKSALNASQLVRQLMVFSSRPDSARPHVESLRDVTQRAVGLCRMTFDRGLRVVVGDLSAADQVVVESAAMEQVILNILINARHAVQNRAPDEAQIEVFSELRDEGEPRVTLHIRDNGVGMDDATLVRMSEPFFTTKPPGQGTGLGLSTAWATIRDHQGRLECSSKLGRGSTLSINLPASGRLSQRDPTASPTLNPTAGRRVLVLDDEPGVREVVGRMLEAAGYLVVQAASGAEGVALVSAQPVDAVVMDYSMPGQPAERTLFELRSMHALLPIVMFSGLGAWLEGADAHLVKPVRSQELLFTLEQVILARARGGAAGALSP